MTERQTRIEDWNAGQRWAKHAAIQSPGVTYTIRQARRHLSYRYEDGLMSCTGPSGQIQPCKPTIAPELPSRTDESKPADLRRLAGALLRRYWPIKARTGRSQK